MPMRDLRVQAIVLRRRDLKEADRVVVFYTRERGKIAAVAKGVRRSRSKTGAGLEPLSFVDGVLYRKAGSSLATLTQVQAVHSNREIREDILRFAAAQVLAELVDRLTPDEQPDERLFRLLQFFSIQLCKSKEPESILRTAQIKILAVLGYAPEVLRSVISGTPIAEGEKTAFSASLGGVLTDEEQRHVKDARILSKRARAFLAACLAANPQETRGFRLTPQTAAEVRSILNDHLIYHMNVKLKSEEFFESVIQA